MTGTNHSLWAVIKTRSSITRNAVAMFLLVVVVPLCAWVTGIHAANLVVNADVSGPFGYLDTLILLASSAGVIGFAWLGATLLRRSASPRSRRNTIVSLAVLGLLVLVSVPFSPSFLCTPYEYSGGANDTGVAVTPYCSVMVPVLLGAADMGWVADDKIIPLVLWSALFIAAAFALALAVVLVASRRDQDVNSSSASS